MKIAAYVDTGIMEIRDIPVPVPDDHELLVKVEYCGICGSDIHQVQYGMEEPGNLMMGHEGSGVVAGLGRKVTGWSEGERVIIRRVNPCGRCWHCHNHLSSMCRNKRYTSNGAYAEYLTCTPDHLYRLPDDVSLEAAALWNPLTNALHAVQLSSLKLGDLAVVLGAGPIGLFTIASARRAGAAPLLATEIQPRRAEAARTLGATVLDPLKDDVVRAITDIREFGADVVFECAGAANTLQEAIQYTRPGGQVVLIGIHMEFFAFSTLLWVMKEINVQAAFGLTDQLPLAVEMLRDRTITPEGIVSSIIPLEELPSMMKKLFGPNDEIKVLVKP
ncbi:MAG: galactitol-1-phosphate 5-dehydrogenase [Candidatus Abyssubacteria bacterium]